ncbi:MFS transporter [Plastoroseomonas arctica]|uniref:MFS transporter n=1 Tax=Plastoroseomonas arctica TaxID=1509237 RepID=A0AAF1KRQ3_9PROT|nr:MFS transporter [Plastoroseomonas arctica]MBR0654642.1 MFS transporter [Plastoroseomonas arctica]
MRAPGPLLASPSWRLSLVATLYFYQGIVAGFALTALPNHAASLGASTAELGAYAAAIGLPWILQPLWGPVVDRFGGMRMGRRRFWVMTAMAGSLAAQSCLLWLGEARPGELSTIAAIFTLHSLCAALMDTATDAMIIDHTPTDQMGAATACTRAGLVSGIAVGAVVFAWVLPQAGLAQAAMVLLCLGLLAAIMPLLVREAPDDACLSLRRRTVATGSRIGALVAELGRGMVRPVHLALLLFCLLQDFCGALFRLPLGVYLIQQEGWTAGALSTAQGMIGLASGTLGAWLVGRWTDRVGPARALGWLLGASAAAHVASGAVLGLSGGWAGPAALSLSGITSALSFVALAPAVMHASRGAVAASRFALYMAALNLGDVLGSAVAGPAAALGVVPLALAVGAGYGLLALGSASMVRRFQQ